jgi:XRE family aerobic/anaerobic benzoate catabolism transcriptional regulator
VVDSSKSADDNEFLSSLGHRVRDRRQQLGLTRRELSLASGLSERYLAQLESGAGNISILLIRKVASALDCDLESLLSGQERDAGIDQAMRVLRGLSASHRQAAIEALVRRYGDGGARRAGRIALIGLRGAGKSTLGRLLAARLHIRFVELDEAIERELGASLENIFSLYGQQTYRDAERRVLQTLTARSEPMVIATGGSVVLEEATYALLRERCFTVWLKASAAEHMDRVIAQGDLRPMKGRAQAMAELRAILAQRDPLYAMADAVVDTSGATVEASLVALASALAHEPLSEPRNAPFDGAATEALSDDVSDRSPLAAP